MKGVSNLMDKARVYRLLQELAEGFGEHGHPEEGTVVNFLGGGCWPRVDVCRPTGVKFTVWLREHRLQVSKMLSEELHPAAIASATELVGLTKQGIAPGDFEATMFRSEENGTLGWRIVPVTRHEDQAVVMDESVEAEVPSE
jgi:hypothetical protein